MFDATLGFCMPRQANVGEDLPLIFARLHHHPLMTPQEEIHMSTLVQDGMAENATPRQKRAAKRAQNRMMLANMRLVVSACKRITRTTAGLGYADLFQEGMIGLSRAIERFDPTRGYKFSTYAYWWIRQGISRALDNNALTIRRSVGAVALRYRIGKYIQEQQHTTGQLPSSEQIRQHFDLDRQTYDLIIASPHCISLDSVIRDQSETSWYEILEDPSPAARNTVDQLVDSDVETLQVAVQLLEPRHREVIIRRRLKAEPDSLQVIATDMGISRERVRQIEREGVRMIHKRLTACQVERNGAS